MIRFKIFVSGPSMATAGEIEMAGTGLVTTKAKDERLAPVLRRLFEKDFDEAVGFPPVRMRFKAGTRQALEAGVTYLQQHLGLRCLGLSVMVVGDDSSKLFQPFPMPRVDLASAAGQIVAQVEPRIVDGVVFQAFRTPKPAHRVVRE